jgi:hypothetical protein
MPKILTNNSYAFFLVPFLFILPARKSCAQRIEVGATLGAANYVGDLAPSMVASETHPALGFFGRYNISSSFAVTAGINFTRVSGSDKHFPVNQPRNLSFRSNITEYATTVEFNFSKYALGILDKKFTSYVFLGLGMFQYNPQAYYRNEWIDLRGIQTEGKSYNTLSMMIPFGMGIKWRMNRSFALEASVGFRKTYTDYLDDVSDTYSDVAQQQQNKGITAAILTDRSAEINNGEFRNKPGYRRGNPDFNDWYVMGGITLSYRIFNRQKCARFY